MSIVNQVDISELLKSSRTIAVVGLSSNSLRPSYGVSAYMQRSGYRIIPVNPVEKEILGEKCYASLQDIPEPVDIVDVFRNPEAAVPIARDAVAIGAKCLWLQEGVINQEAADIAAAAGLSVVMDHCILKKHRELC
jgi:uncharacterized protein